MENVHTERISQLRALMSSRGWDAVVITGSDPHDSEYQAERWKQVCWLSGFTGEAGDIVVTADHVGLWTDSRYFIQAASQLEGTGAIVHPTRVPDQVLIPEWLHSTLDGGATVAVDSFCVSASFTDKLGSLGMEVIGVPDLLGALWSDRPGVPQTEIFRVESGESSSERIGWLRDRLEENSCDAIFLSALDEIAWLLNVRASDIEYNPFVISYLLVSRDSVKWFVIKDAVEDSVTKETFASLEEQEIEILPYEDASLYLDACGKLWVDRNRICLALLNAVGTDIFDCASPISLKKAVKNGYELDGIRKAHLADGIAMEKFLFWLEQTIKDGGEISEWDASVKLEQLRAEKEGYLGGSFMTISAYRKGAALPHYITPNENAPMLRAEGLYLCDSGGQYYTEGGSCGTTDITRTVPLGPCTDLEKEDYTLVLKGHIDLAMAVFPPDTTGSQIDAIARMPLWRTMRNFGHGTGHGVGYILGCHEGPQDIRHDLNRTAFRPGMIVTDEPGIYREGLHGVRHENILLVREKGEGEFGRFLEFEPLTFCHFDTSIIDRNLLSSDEINWLNAYNASVYDRLANYLPDEVALWLKEKTAAI